MVLSFCCLIVFFCKNEFILELSKIGHLKINNNDELIFYNNDELIFCMEIGKKLGDFVNKDYEGENQSF